MTDMTTEELVKFLEKHPKVKTQIAKMIGMSSGRDEILLGDDAEDFVVTEGQKLRKIFLEEWAEMRAKKSASAFEEKHKSIRKDQKKS